jgi:hypothetical protein
LGSNTAFGVANDEGFLTMFALNVYRQYWLTTALLLAGVIFAVEQGGGSWILQKFPDPIVQICLLIVFVVFLYAYYSAHGVARELAASSEAFAVFHQKGTVNLDTVFGSVVGETIQLRDEHAKAKVGEFALLYQRACDQVADRLEAGINHIDGIRVFLFFLGLTITLMGMVAGFAYMSIPADAEQAKQFAFNIIKALGLAYLPATSCMLAGLVLYIITHWQRNRVSEVLERFDATLYRVAVLGCTNPSRNNT